MAADKCLSDHDFLRLSTFINTQMGINMPIEKKLLLQNRLIKRVEYLNMTSFNEYVNFVFGIHGGEELHNIMDLSTTNTTHFFREYQHFDFLSKKIVPELCHEPGRSAINIWCAGCSSGQEAYTLAICLTESLKEYPDISFEITATDLSRRMLQHAKEGIYNESELAEMPYNLKSRYFITNNDPSKKTVKVVPEISNRIAFHQLNFMDAHYPVKNNFDIIFCRNVLIYFSRENQLSIVRKMLVHLKKGGYFFNGHSEALINMDLPLKKMLPTVSKYI